jgi:hypothetical protein
MVAMDEVDHEPFDEDDVQWAYVGAVEVLAPLWDALGALDDERRLTELGWWGLPQALHRIWSGSAGG